MKPYKTSFDRCIARVGAGNRECEGSLSPRYDGSLSGIESFGVNTSDRGGGKLVFVWNEQRLGRDQDREDKEQEGEGSKGEARRHRFVHGISDKEG